MISRKIISLVRGDSAHSPEAWHIHQASGVDGDGGYMKRVCCTCGLIIDNGDGEKDEYISHTYCDTCYEVASEQIDDYLLKKYPQEVLGEVVGKEVIEEFDE